jgi:hypothetical protein
LPVAPVTLTCIGAASLAVRLRLGILPALGEQALAAADHQGVDPDPVLVDQVVIREA